MLYNVASSFVKIDEKQGIIQNASSGNSIEVSDEATTDSGIILKPGESLSFTDTDIYVRTIGNKTSAVRVVPFVQGFNALSDSKSNSEELVASYTSILINSITPEGEPKQELVSYVNPNKTKVELSTFGQMIAESTVNSYKSTYRVDKTLCDRKAIPYSEYLIIDSPFDENPKDLCTGENWWGNGTRYIYNKAENFITAYILQNLTLTFGGKDFTAALYFKAQSSSNDYAGIWGATTNCNGGRQGEIALIRNGSNSNTKIEIYNTNGSSALVDTSVSGAAFDNTWHHLELDYSHSDSKFRVFLDGTLKKTVSVAIPRLARYVFIGGNAYNLGYRLTGAVREVKIWDGVALHTENFTPE